MKTITFERLEKEGLTFVKTAVDIKRVPALVLDKKLCVIAANEPFCKTFQVKLEDTKDRVVYELGNGQWNIPALRKLLEDMVLKHTFFSGFEVTCDFPIVGHKVMILNAQQIYFKKDTDIDLSQPFTLLAIEDITEIVNVAEAVKERL